MTDLPTKPGPYYWREEEADEWEPVIVIHHNDPFMEPTVKFVVNDFENDLKAMEGQWLRIPTADELVELLRLVDEVTGWENGLIDTNGFSEDGEAMINDIGYLREYADKLRKEVES